LVAGHDLVLGIATWAAGWGRRLSGEGWSARLGRRSRRRPFWLFVARWLQRWCVYVV